MGNDRPNPDTQTSDGGFADAVLRAAPLPIAVFDSNTTVLAVNRAAERMLGWQESEVRGEPAPIVAWHDPERVAELLARALAGEQLAGEEVCLLDKDGNQRELEAHAAPIRTADGTVEAVVISWLDVAARKQHEQQLAFLATHDELTGLPNRRVFEESLARAVRQARHGRHSLLLIADLDQLKLVNDAAGHQAGDLVLAQVAGALADALRPGDVVARIGGDEFAALVFDVPFSGARAVAERIISIISTVRVSVREHTFDPTISIGVAPIDGSLSEQQVLAKADEALFAAKQLGRNRSILTDDERLNEFTHRSDWSRPLKDALASDRFLLALQPIVQVDTGLPLFHEALIRLRGDDNQVHLPAAFLPAAQRLGLMPQIDLWVIRHARRLLDTDPELALFVNLSPAGFEDDSLLDQLEHELHDLSPGRLTLEITESGLIANADRTQRRLKRLQTLGCQIALDDFGDGFSSFARLRALPFDYLKIDGSLTRHVDHDPVEQAISAGIIQLGHALGLQVIAEQVETASSATTLHQLGVDYGQGNHWAPATLLPPAPTQTATPTPLALT